MVNRSARPLSPSNSVEDNMAEDLKAWLEKVDSFVLRFVGLTVHQLADPPYALWFEDGLSPRAAARRWIRFDQGLE